MRISTFPHQDQLPLQRTGTHDPQITPRETAGRILLLEIPRMNILLTFHKNGRESVMNTFTCILKYLQYTPCAMNFPHHFISDDTGPEARWKNRGDGEPHSRATDVRSECQPASRRECRESSCGMTKVVPKCFLHSSFSFSNWLTGLILIGAKSSLRKLPSPLQSGTDAGIA
ncbi:MAG: hypothetical protein ABSF70_09310 [Terracidiphilus sp.]|jgi:hypothetical protein